MARYFNIGDQFFFLGLPADAGKIFVFESGTEDLKDTFNSPDQKDSQKNTNPIILSGDGKPPNVFFEGTARMKVMTADDQLIEDKDPVGGDQTKGAFSDWNPQISYDQNTIVTGSNARHFLSIGPANKNNNPTTTTGLWQEIFFINEYRAEVTFRIGMVAVSAVDGNLYTSRVDGNINNEPSASPTQWRVLTAPGDIVGPASSVDNSLPRNDGTTGILQQGSLIIVDDLGNMSGVLGLTAETAEVGADAPFFKWNENDAAPDEKLWRAIANGGNLSIATRDDADAVGKTGIQIQRTAAAIAAIILGNAGDDPPVSVFGDLIMATAGKGLNLTADGGGILNRYKATLFTPTVGTDATAFTTITYTTQDGFHVEFPDFSIIGGTILTLAVAGGSGFVQIQSLPVTARSTSPGGIILTQAAGFSAATTPRSVSINGGATTAYFRRTVTGDARDASNQPMAAAEWDGGESFDFFGVIFK